jgi:hypothetical protein
MHAPFLILILACVTGAALAQAFRVYILLPASLVFAVFAVVVAMQNGHGWAAASLEALVSLGFVQFGYFIGLLLRSAPILSLMSDHNTCGRFRPKRRPRDSWMH